MKESPLPARNIVIVIARCARLKQPFGIRFEQKTPGKWSATWAFAIKQAVAKREGYASAPVAGDFVLGEGFPGCPHCLAESYCGCVCGTLACWDGRTRFVTCPTCGRSGELTATITNLSGGGDR